MLLEMIILDRLVIISYNRDEVRVELDFIIMIILRESYEHVTKNWLGVLLGQ